MAEQPLRSRWEPAAFAAACVVVGLAFQGTRGLWETDEGRYAETARRMLETGEWLVPMRHGVPHLTKPPGTYWSVAAGLGALGTNEWGARLLLGLAFGASAACVRWIGTGLLGAAAGARGGWVYLAMLYPFAMGSTLTPDTFLASGLLVSIGCSVASVRSEHPWRWHLLAGLALAAAMFVKGHVALLPWAGFVAGWLWGGRRLAPGRAVVSWPGVGVGLALGTAWFLWAAETVDGARDQFVGKELTRFTHPGDHAPRPIWFYAALLVAGTTPWWLAAARGVRSVGLSPARRVLLGWAGVTFVVLQGAASKNWSYLLPIAAPVALWAAAGARDPASPWPVRPWVLGLWLALLCGGRLAAAYVPQPKDMRAVAQGLRAADPTGTLPVAIYSGRDLDGLEFYLGGHVRRLESREVHRNDKADGALSEEARVRASRGEPWLLVTETDVQAERGVRRHLGESAHPVRDVNGWKLLRIVPTH